MANRQIYQLNDSTPVAPALADVFPYQDAAGAAEPLIATFTQLKASLLLNNVNNTSDAAKPISDLQAVVNTAKQATLVSGTNIKTVNGTSVLGAGDIPTIPITIKVSLSSAQILALNTTPITLVAAQGAGTFINVLSIAMRLTYNTITYATNTTSRIAIGSFSPIVTDSTILSNTSTAFNVISPTQSLTVTGTADWVNIPLKISVITGNPTAGNSTMDVYITYNVVTL